MSVVPVMLQYQFRQEKQIPAYLRSLEPRTDVFGYDDVATPGTSLIPKTHGEAIDTSSLHSQLVAGGLRLTHASRVDRLFNPGESLSERFYYVLRFHYFPVNTAVVHSGVDTEKLVQCLEEISAMAYWGARVDLNRGKVCPWISVSCKGRVQRYTSEDLDRPEMRKIINELGDKIGSAPVAADRTMHYLGNNTFVLKPPS